MPDRVRAHPHAEALQSPSLIGPLAARRNGEQDSDGRRTAEQLPQLDRRRTVSRSTICRRHGMTTRPPGRRREGRGLRARRGVENDSGDALVAAAESVASGGRARCRARQGRRPPGGRPSGTLRAAGALGAARGRTFATFRSVTW